MSLLHFRVPGSILVILSLVLTLSPTAQANLSSKRGLCFVPNDTTPQDNAIWKKPSNALTWYFNYNNYPSYTFRDVHQSRLEFVPML